MKVLLSEIRRKMTAVLESRGFSTDEIPFLINMYLGGEMRGHTSHGLASFSSFVSHDFSALPKPEVIKETHSLFMIDAKSNPGTIVGKRAADEAIKRAQSEIIGTALIKNMDSWLRPGAMAQYIADQGYLAIVTNDGGGASIAPPGGYDAVVGTNPIAYGIPTEYESLVVDMATAKRAWGQVRLANKYGTDLPAETFYNDSGDFTLDPKKAESVLPFGGYKGFSLALLIEIMSGSLLGMKTMMLNTGTTGSQYGQKLEDRGAFILVIDPSQTTDLATFKRDNTELLRRIKSTRALPGDKIRIPGEEAGNLQARAEANGYIEIPNELWEEIQELQ